MKKMKSNIKTAKYGFSLMELMIVIVIIGILAVGGVMIFGGGAKKAKIVVAKKNHTELCKAAAIEMMRAQLDGSGTKIFNDAYTYAGSYGTGANAVASAIAKGYNSDLISPYSPQPQPHNPSNITSTGVAVGNGTSDHKNKDFAGIIFTTGGNSGQVTINMCSDQDNCSGTVHTCVLKFSNFGG